MSYEYSGPGLDQEYTPPKSKSTRNCCLSAAGGCGCLTVVLILLGVVSFYLFGNLFRVGVNHATVMEAFRGYALNNVEYPPAYSVDENGTPLHSWRVLILPYFDEDTYFLFFGGPRPSEIYEQIRLDEPWDSEHNRQFHTLMPHCYRDPATKDDRKTHFQMVVGGQCLSDGPNCRSLEQVLSADNPIVLFVEASPAVEWMKPDDLQYDDLIKNGVVLKDSSTAGLTCPHKFFREQIGGTGLSTGESFFYVDEKKTPQQTGDKNYISLEKLKRYLTLNVDFETEEAIELDVTQEEADNPFFPF